ANSRMIGPVLDLEGVTKSYGDFKAVDGLSFAMGPGEVLGFLGPNGAGKTSTMRMILGLLKPNAGSIRLFGAPWSREALPRLGYLPEERVLYKRMRAMEALRCSAGLK